MAAANTFKETQRSTVTLGFDGTVQKIYRAQWARERFENELRILNRLEEKGCPIVPRVISSDHAALSMVITYCGIPVERLSEGRRESLFQELESFGVRHNDPTLANITYDLRSNRFFVIDFEFATLLTDGSGLSFCGNEVAMIPVCA